MFFVKENKKNYSKILLIEHLKLLFPYCRSITGDGSRKTLSYFENYHYEFKRLKFKSGKKVFDWIIPKEWNIKNAFIEHVETKKKYAEFSLNNLHIVGYSHPINKVMQLNDIKPHIYTQKDQPNVIPYVTSYYKKSWGFCMSEREKDKMPNGKYKVLIDSDIRNGFLEMSHAILKGKSKKEILFSSYICHPSMANNELSGPIVMNALLSYLKNNYRKLNYTYRFLMIPETIGSIAYLSKYHKQLKKNLMCGFVLSCLGDENGYSFVETPHANSFADEVINAALSSKKNVKKYSFLDRGSDERQYCSPLVNLPVVTFCKSKFGEFPEYHTSADNYSFVSEKGMQDSLNVLKSMVDGFEKGLFPKVKFKCEPNLGKRNLYPTTSQKFSADKDVELRTNIIAYCDGKNSIFKISNLVKAPLEKTIKEVELLIKNKVLTK